MSQYESRLLTSPHLSSQTRHLLRERMASSEGAPQYLSPQAYKMLESICDDILPQKPLLGDTYLCLAGLIDASFGSLRDGWRFADLPPDLEAWELGMETLNRHALTHYQTSYLVLSASHRGDLLDQAFHGELPTDIPDIPLTTDQMALWMQDVRADIIANFLSHPIAQEALGISALLTGGETSQQGFKHVGYNQLDDFENFLKQM